MKKLHEYIKWIEHHFVLSTLPDLTHQEALQKIVNRTNFGQRKLRLGDFIACDKDGEPMEKPENEFFDKEKTMLAGKNLDKAEDYQKALDSCIFKGWKVITRKAELVGEVTCLSNDGIEIAKKSKQSEWQFNPKYKIIEDLIVSRIELKPTEALTKQLGL